MSVSRLFTMAGALAAFASRSATWAPNTDYKAGQLAVEPGGVSLVAAIDDHNSGSSYDASHWSELTTAADWSTLSGKPAVIAAGADAATARAAIGAGTGNGNSNFSGAYSDLTGIPAGIAQMVIMTGGTYGNRPATTLPVTWYGTSAPATGGTTAGGTAAAVAGLDYYYATT